MPEEEIVTMITQVGIIPALFAYTLVTVKKSLDRNTEIMTKLYERLAGGNNE